MLRLMEPLVSLKQVTPTTVGAEANATAVGCVSVTEAVVVGPVEQVTVTVYTPAVRPVGLATVMLPALMPGPCHL